MATSPNPNGAKSDFNPGQTCLIVGGISGCGCLFSVAMAIFSTGAGVVGFFGDAVKSTGSYQSHQMVETRLAQDAQVKKRLGAPVDVGWFSKSEESARNGQSQVCMRVSVTGKRNSGTAYMETKKIGESWQWHQLSLTVNGETKPIVLEAADGEALCPDFDKPDEPDSANELPET